MRVKAPHQRFAVNVRTGIVDGSLMRPYLLPSRLDEANYLTFLQTVYQVLVVIFSLAIAVSYTMFYIGLHIKKSVLLVFSSECGSRMTAFQQHISQIMYVVT